MRNAFRSIAILAVVVLSACTAPNTTEATNFLIGDGYDKESIVITDISYLQTFSGCSSGDKWHASFTAAKNHMLVKGVICGAPRKAPTFRVKSSVPIKAVVDMFAVRADSIIAQRRRALIDSLRQGLIK